VLEGVVQTIRTDIDDRGVATVELHRPERLNAFDLPTLEALCETLEALARTDEAGVVVLTGAGRGFCAGLDLQADWLGAADPDRGRPQRAMRSQEAIAAVVPLLHELPQPVIAAVNGPAAGGGLSLALASDVRIAAPSASFSAAYVRVGLSGCDLGSSYLLPRLVGDGAAADLLLTGRGVPAEEALRLGLVSQVTAEGEAYATARELAHQMLANSPFGLRMTKQVLRANADSPSLRHAMHLENRTQALCSLTEDHDEAKRAVMERRPAVFADR
jgi:enoyl-CoA hydratase